jgi:branched-chain amino acid transport system ATP-binding protein
MADAILQIDRVSKSFGGLIATNNITIEFERGQIHAIIGPNGAGKTTLINLLSGDLFPNDGTILFNGQDITHLPPHKISQLGIGRSYQKTNIFAEFTCFENCWVAAQSRINTSMRFFRPASNLKAVEKRTEKALELCGLSLRRDSRASAMSYGEQRQLEIGMMLATEPELLLLDEPLAGMGSEESLQVIELLRRLAEDHTLILIEHDMDAVFSIADQLTVMVNGRILETGTVGQIRSSQAVQEAYLGVDEETA